MDFSNQLYICYAIVYKLKIGEQTNISHKILHFIPLLELLHVLLNTRETCLLIFHPFFNVLYKDIFQKKHDLAVKSKS